MRLGEAGSKELYPVSQYYSSTLVTYIRTVLQVEKKSVTYSLRVRSWRLGDPGNHVLPSGASDANAGQAERASDKV